MQDNDITQDKRQLSMTEIMTPDMANFGGKVHGGALLKLLDRVAYACATRYSGYYCVTLSFDHVLFKRPINVGELVTFHACVNYTGRSSMEVGLRVVAENITTGEKRHTNTCYVTMVAVDDNHQSMAITPIAINTPTEQRRYDHAKLRKALKKEYHEKHDQRKTRN